MKISIKMSKFRKLKILYFRITEKFAVSLMIFKLIDLFLWGSTHMAKFNINKKIFIHIYT